MMPKKREVKHIKPATSPAPGFDNFDKCSPRGETPETIIVTNPNRRCIYCKGREVLTINTTTELVTDSSLVGTNILICKDKVQCSKNIVADKTDVSMTFKGDKMTYLEVARGKETIVKIDKGESVE